MTNKLHKIAPRLFQGANPPQGKRLSCAGLDVLVLCALEHQDPSVNYPGVMVIHAPMDDAERVPIQVATAAAKLAAIQHQRGAKILVVCHEGRNRSGLVSALILRELHFGTGKKCADHIRRSRPRALTNPTFYNWLSSLPAKP